MLTSILVVAAIPAIAIYLYQKLYYLRFQQYAAWPQLQPSLLWGHLKAMNEFIESGVKQRHVDILFREIKEHLGNPPVYLLDVRPAQSYPIGILCNHEVAEQVSRATKALPYSMDKSPTMDFMEPLTGPSSVLTSQGEEWKALRRRFNPGFAPQHLLTLLPCILDRSWHFFEILDRYAASGEVFSLDELCINLTFDIIGAVTMDEDFRAQAGPEAQSEIVKLYRAINLSYRHIPTMANVSSTPRALARSHQAKFAELKEYSAKGGKKSRSVVSLSLQDTDELTQRILDQTCDQLKTFLFAGHDTTSILLQWAFYELSRTPRALESIRKELDEIFGTDPSPSVVRDALLAPGGEQLIQRMSYVSAVIKETLRLYPPAGTSRYHPPGSGVNVQLPDGSSLSLDGVAVYNCATIIQRDEAIYGETKDDFIPERWLGDTDTSMETNVDTKTGKIPPSAWRPFERGPRNCIGQELANLEARVILACAVRRYDFTKIGLGEIERDEKGQPILNEKGQFETASQLYNIMQITAKPVDGTRVRVQLTPESAKTL
ncbi:Cytochrome p450 [Aspergillus sclerotialis]|uniref:Cytochrome p450 n=1 Tax=Aspergillus sclerotialis TaxID=2070753 RepID=A0A3A2ZQC2_9EURO|nr:Cytochrome p450 [Aspergillus sclerotialis]